MKKVTVIFKNEVKVDLLKYLKNTSVKGATFTNVSGFGRQYGHKELISGADFDIILLPKIKMEILLIDEDVDKFVNDIQEHIQTGRMGDGKIWVENIENVVRIRTGEHGNEAII